MYLVYSCVFFQWGYVKLLDLLLKSYALTEDKKDITYLVICNFEFKEQVENIFNSLNIDGKIWCLNLKTIFEAGFARLFIYDYPEINKYEKILYLDTDILVVDGLTNILSHKLEDKIYAIEEGTTADIYHGSQLYTAENNPNASAFSSGILLFNNCENVKNLFSKTLGHIKNHIAENKPIPCCLDQPFINYNFINENLYDNKLIHNYIKNCPDKIIDVIIYHFPGGIGWYNGKIKRMSDFMKDHLLSVNTFIENRSLENKKYTWQNSIIEFLPGGNMNAFGTGQYKYINTGLIKADFGGREHFLRFNEDYTSFISIRKDDFESVKGQII